MATNETSDEVLKTDEDPGTEVGPNTEENPSFTDPPKEDTVTDQADNEVTEENIEGAEESVETSKEKESEQEEEGELEDEGFEDIEEIYERQIDDNGETKVVTDKRIIRVRKSENRPREQTIQFEEEYLEEVDENGEKTTVTKKRPVKVHKRVLSKLAVGSFIEQEEEIEEEEMDESGMPKVVKKTVIVRIPKGDVIESKESFEEVEEEYEEEEEDENGEKIKVTKTRMVKVLKKKGEIFVEDQLPTEEGAEEVPERISGEGESEEGSEESEEEEVEEAEEDLKEGETEEERKERKMKKIKEGEGEEHVEGEKKKRKRRKKKQVEEEEKKPEEEVEVSEDKTSVEEVEGERRESEEEMRKSEGKEDEETEEAVEEQEEEKPTEELEEEGGKEEGKDLKSTLSSDELRLIEQRAEIEKQYETLVKLRIEKMGIKKKSIFLNNKLMNYFKKQKMDHVFTDAKEDPDMEQKYNKKLMLYYETSKQMNEEKQRINTEWERQRSVNGDLDAKVKSGWEELVNHKKEVAARLIDARTGRTVQQDKALEDLLLRQENQWRQIADCKLAQIKLKHKIDAKKEERKMDHMGMDFNLMDYEKLSSLKEYYNDKITERDIEITEVNQKMAVMDDKLNNVREQLKHKEAEMEREQMKLQRISSELNKKRANLNRVKATKYATERNTAKMKQQSGLMVYPTLLKDYEVKNQEIRELSLQIEELRHNFRDEVVRIRKLREMVKKRTKGNFSLASSSVYGTS